MRMFHDKKLMRLVQCFAGKDRVREIWQGSHRLWPDDSSRSNALRIELPAYGTAEWAYWVHAMDAVQRLGASDECYMRIKIGDKYYYLLDSPDGSVPLQVDGGALYFEAGGDFPTDGLGTKVYVEAKVPERAERTDEEYAFKQSYTQGVYDEQVDPTNVPGVPNGAAKSVFKVMLPLIPSTLFKTFVTKGQKNSGVRAWFELKSLPSEDVHCKCLQTHAGGRGDIRNMYYLRNGSTGDNPQGNDPWNYWWNAEGNKYVAGSWGYILTMMSIGGGCDNFNMNVVYPSFDYEFNCRVVNVNVADS